LISKRDRKPKYVGIEQITQRKRFHIEQIVENEVQRIPSIFASFLSKATTDKV